MIVTLTPNPSLDRTVTLPSALQRGGVNRLESAVTEPGGKGVNVARVLSTFDEQVTAVLPASVEDPLLVAIQGLHASGLTVLPVPVPGLTRINTAVTEPDGTTTKLNEQGGSLHPAQIAGIEQALVQATAQAQAENGDAVTWVVLSGSLPPGVPVAWYAQLVKLLRPLGVRIAVDTSDAPLLALASSLPGAAPDLIKPNGEELAQLVGADAQSLEQGAQAGNLSPIVEAAQILVNRGVKAVMVTLGAAGAVLATQDGVWHASAPEVPVLSTVGAGDSSVAGYVLADVRGGDETERLRTAMSFGAAAASLPGTGLPTPTALPKAQSVITKIS